MMRTIARFLNEHVLGILNLRVVRESSLQKLLQEETSLRRQVVTDAAIDARFSQIEASLDHLSSELAHLGGELSHIEKAAAESEKRVLEELSSRDEKLEQRVRQIELCIADKRSYLPPADGPGSLRQQEKFLSLARQLSPKSAIGQRKIRIGGPGDGGYVMLDDFAAVTGAISCGIGDDDSWDLDIASRGIPTFQFDGSIDRAPTSHANLHFFPRNVVADQEKGETIGGILRNCVQSPGPCLLKMDIEGAEWDVFDRMDLDDIRAFSQIVCEFHHFNYAPDVDWLERALRTVGKLSAAMQVVHVHGNNCGALTSVWNVPFPIVLEVTFANRARYQFAECEEIFPTALDQPNWPDAADTFLGRFQF